MNINSLLVNSHMQLKESPAVSGHSKSGDAAAVALLSKGYGNIALVVCKINSEWGRSCLIFIGST